MKKILWYTIAAFAAVLAIASCSKKEVEPEDTNVVATVSANDLVDAAAAAYAAWEDDTTIPAELKVGDKTLTLPQYQYAISKLLANLAAGDKSEVKVKGYKAAEHPDRDSYDAKEIAVTGGAKISEGTEDIADIAKRLVASMEEKLVVPNQTLITRTGASALAFSTNRATVTILRTIAAYKEDGSLPKTVSTEYLSAAASLKGFAEQFVKILDIWSETVGTVSADGSHCTDNNSAWQNVHFVPIPHSGGAYADGVDQYDAKYQPYFTVTVDGKEYTSAQTWGIALRGIVDMITTEGSAKFAATRNPFCHTMGNGASLKEPLPAIYDYDIWGQYPWYESTNDGPAINLTEISPYLIARLATWFLARQGAPQELTGISPLGKIGNYQIFGTDPDQCIVEDGVNGFVSAQRMWLIAARFYKYLLDNNITDNVYDAVKEVKFSTDLYGVEMPDIELKTKSVTLDSQGNAVRASFMAKKEWTASSSENWIHVDPASGDAAVEEAVVSITADANTGEERTGKVVIRGGNVTDGLEISVTQAAYVDPSSVTLKDFAKEFVKGLEVWEATVGTVESENKHLIEKGTAWENVHFIPVGKTGGDYDNHPGNQHDAKYTPWTVSVNGTTYTSAQAWEIAVRGLLDMVLTDGQGYIAKMTSRNKPGYTLGDNKAFSAISIATPSEYAKWNSYPWYEEDGVTYNGAPVTEVGIDMITKATLGHLVRGLVGIQGVFNPLGAIGNFQQFGTDDSTLILEGYEGLISPMRELILMMRVYKYLLDNNIDANVYSAIKDVKFDYDMYHQVPSLKVFAQEFVKGLEVWQSTVGNVDADGVRNSKAADGAWTNVHYIPIGNTNNSDFKDYGNNQYDDGKEPWKLNVAGTEYTSSQAWEIAIRGLLNLVTAEGEALLPTMDTRNKAYTLQDNGKLTDAMPAPSAGNKWGKNPWYEYGNLVTYNGAAISEVDVNFMVKVGAWHVVRSFIKTAGNASPLGMVGNFQEFGTTSGTLNLDGYSGLISPMRELMVLMRIYKDLLDNNVTENVYTAIKDKKYSFDLYGI